MEPSGVSGLLSHKPSFHTIYILLKKTKYGYEDKEF